tara:strand:- start:63 stop:680 length:618 start_codon:yes stop_codon:yes gene_type:complete
MSYDYLFKLIVIGDSGVGKTALVKRLNGKPFPIEYTSTIGLDFGSKIIMIQHQTLIKSYIWDTAGQEIFSSIIANYYKNIDGAIIVFDVTNRDSFRRCTFWLSELDANRRSLRDISVILLGNKLDHNNREVSEEEAKLFAKDNGLLYMETSAKTGENIEIWYRMLIHHIVENMDPEIMHRRITDNHITFNTKVHEDSSMGCCCIF